MKFLKSEGRLVCLLEREDMDMVLSYKLPPIDLLLIPKHYEQDFMNKPIWKEVISKTKNGFRNVIYF